MLLPFTSYQEMRVVTEKYLTRVSLLFTFFISRTLGWQPSMGVHQSAKVFFVFLILQEEKTPSKAVFSELKN